MPELPEVEEVRRSLEPQLLGHPIAAISVCRPDFITPADADLTLLVGRHAVQTLRHGKKLFLVFDDGQTLHLHLGMTGRVDCLPAADARAPHTHVILHLDTPAGPHDIRFCDPRRFGGLWHYSSLQEALAREVTGRLGPDALQVTADHLAARWHQAAGHLKARLLGQRDVAGLGNIYVDEALWRARLHPLQRVGRIPADRLAALVKAIHQVLQQSLASGGTTLRDYRNAANQPGGFRRKLQVYGRGGQPCRRCGAPLRSAVIAGRTTVFCPACQRVCGSGTTDRKVR